MLWLLVNEDFFDIDQQQTDRDKRFKQKQFCYLWKKRNEFCSSLYSFCMQKNMDLFDQSKFINVSTEEQSLLFTRKPISESERDKVDNIFHV